MKKLANLYRLLRIGAHGQLDEFIGTGDTGPYQAAAILLAALVGTPTNARIVLSGISTFDGSGDVVDALNSMSECAQLVTWIEANKPVMRDMKVYQQWAPQVARYGIETYQLFEPK